MLLIFLVAVGRWRGQRSDSVFLGAFLTRLSDRMATSAALPFSHVLSQTSEVGRSSRLC